MNRVGRLVRLTLAALMLMPGLLLPAQAQTEQQVGLSITPAILEATVATGQTSQRILYVRNISDQPLVIQVGVRSLIPEDELIAGYDLNNYDASKWLKPHLDNLSLQPNQQKPVSFGITVPATAGPGGHYAQIVFRPLSSQPDQNNSSTQITPEITSQILINVPGEISQQIDADLSGPNLIAKNDQIKLIGHITNTGNSHVLIQPFITIKRSNGTIIDRQSLSPQLVLPGTAKTIDYDWQPDGQSGRLMASMEIRYDSPAQSIFANSGAFWLLPPTNLMLIYSFMILLGFGLLIKIYAKFWRRVRPRRLVYPSGRTALQNERRDNSSRRLPTVVLDHLSADSSLPEKPPTKSKSINK